MFGTYWSWFLPIRAVNKDWNCRSCMMNLQLALESLGVTSDKYVAMSEDVLLARERLRSQREPTNGNEYAYCTSKSWSSSVCKNFNRYWIREIVYWLINLLRISVSRLIRFSAVKLQVQRDTLCILLMYRTSTLDSVYSTSWRDVERSLIGRTGRTRYPFVGFIRDGISDSHVVRSHFF